MLEELKKLSPAWWGAIAAAIGAGATLFPESRLVAGAVAGAAMFVVARKMSPCCAECAGSGGGGIQQQQTQQQPQAERSSFNVSDWLSKGTSASSSSGECVGCQGGLLS
jgi:hypothetical protein